MRKTNGRRVPHGDIKARGSGGARKMNQKKKSEAAEALPGNNG